MEYQSFLVVRKEIMKYKILILATLMTMCSGSEGSNTEQRVVSLSTTHTEVIQVLGGENLLVGVDSFSETELPIEKIDAFTVTAEDLVKLNPDLVVIAFDFNGIVEGLENLEMNYALLPPARNFEDVYSQIEEIGQLIDKEDESLDLVSSMKNDVEEVIENFSEEKDPFGSGYPEFSEEEVLNSNPNLIVVGHSDYLNKDLSTRVGWEQIAAVQTGNVFFLDENLANNWGASTVDLLNTLSEIGKSQEDPGLIYINKYSEEIQNPSVFENNILYLVLFILIGLFLYSRRNQQKEAA